MNVWFTTDCDSLTAFQGLQTNAQKCWRKHRRPKVEENMCHICHIYSTVQCHDCPFLYNCSSSVTSNKTSALKIAAKLLTCRLHHFLSNLHSLLLLHKVELAYVPSSLIAGRKAEGKHGQRQNTSKQMMEEHTVSMTAPLLVFLSSKHQRKWSWRHSGSGCGPMMSSLIHRCLTGSSGWTGILEG